MKHIINSTYANLWLNAADQLGLDYRIEDEETALAYIFNEHYEVKVKSHDLSLNLKERLCQSINKELTSKLLSAQGIPVPAFALYDKKGKAIDYAMGKINNRTSIVIKPSAGSNAIGICINPTTISQVQSAIKEAFTGSKKIIIEEHIKGHHYRITVLDDEIIAVTQRIPAYVTGDGVSSIQELVENKNIKRAKGNLPLIFLRDGDHRYMKSEGIALSRIYPEGVHVRLQTGCDYEIGGDRVRIHIESIPSANKAMFVKAVQALGLRFGGIDYISPDITCSYKKVKTAINEINSSPHQDVHYFDSYPNDNYAAKRIIQKIFESPVVV